MQWQKELQKKQEERDMSGFNFSSLFGGFKTSGFSFGSFNFSEYASIKNGSYRKVLKSYYAQQKADQTKTSTADKTKKNQLTDNTELAKMKRESDGLKTAAEALGKQDLWKQTDGKYDTDKITSAVKNFVNEYNDVLGQAQKAGTKDISQAVGYMTGLTKNMSKSLEKLGITVDAAGKMSLDEETLKNADMKALQNMFSGIRSYGNQVADRAGEISSKAIMNSSVYSSSGVFQSNYSGMFNKWI